MTALLSLRSDPVFAQVSTTPTLPLVFIDTTYTPPAGPTITVPAGGDFQAALNQAQPGDVIVLQAGATFTGNFMLPNKAGTGWITIRTSTPDRALPGPGTRITPTYACALPKIVSPNGFPALTAALGAHHYRFIGVEVTIAADVAVIDNLIALGNPTSLAEVPHDLIFDRVYVHGNPYVDLRRGIRLNSASTAIIDSYVADVHDRESEAQAIAGWGGPGPFKIVNNYLEASGENLLFGGADPAQLPGCDPLDLSTYDNCLVPSDIEIRRNHFFKPLSWRVGDPSYAGIHWIVKNLLELKNAQRVLIDGNLFENNWQDAQGGTAILFTVRNQDGTAPWSVVQDVTVTNNIVRHVGQSLGMHGWDDLQPSRPSARILIKNNLLVDNTSALGSGWLFNDWRGITDLVLDHNTGFMDEASMMAGYGTNTGFVYTNNLTPVGVKGFEGLDTTQGLATLTTYFPGAVFDRNVLAGGSPNLLSILYPSDNFFPLSLDAVGFLDLVSGNYRLAASSPYKNAGIDGTDIGADIDAIEAALAEVTGPIRPELPRAFVETTSVPSTGATIAVPAGGDFQAALNRAQPGDVITLEAGATYTGNFTLPATSGSGWIIIRTSAPDSSLPPPGTRIGPVYASVLPKIVSPNSDPALTTASGANHYRLLGLEVSVADGVAVNSTLVRLGNGETSSTQLPAQLILDRVFVHGSPTVNLYLGVALNTAWTAVIDSYISDIHAVGAYSMAIAGWNGPGPFKIVNDYLEVAGTPILFGGTDPSIPQLVPSDIEVRGNHVFKPLMWRPTDPEYAGTPWTVLGHLELKNARRVLVDGNLFEQNWLDSAGGIAIVLDVSSQGTAPWSVVEDVTFTSNIVRHTGSGIGLQGRDTVFPSQPMRRILIGNNLFDDVSGVRWGGPGMLFLAVDGIEDLVLDHNTGLQDGSILYADGGTNTGFVYRNSIAPSNAYGGVHGTGAAPGLQTLNTYFPGYVFDKNVIVGGDSLAYPADNFFPASLADVGFVDLTGGNYRLAASSPYKNAGTDGIDIGADFDVLDPATAGARAGTRSDPAACAIAPGS